MNDPAAQPWRGATAAQLGDWPLARRRFEQGREAIYFMDPVWRARLTALHAMSALKTNDLGAVEPLLNVVIAEDYDPEARAEAGLVEAGLAAASGNIDQAIALYDELSRSDWRPAHARALLEKGALPPRWVWGWEALLAEARAPADNDGAVGDGGHPRARAE